MSELDADSVAAVLQCPVCGSRSVRISRVRDQRVAFICNVGCVEFSLTREVGIPRVHHLVWLAMGGGRDNG